MSATKKLGTNYVVARNTGSFGAPTFPLLNIAEDIKLTVEPSGKFDSSDRSGSGNTTIPTRYKVSANFKALWDGSTGLTAFRTAFLAGTSILAGVFDGATSGRGLHGEWAVTSFSPDFPLAAGQPLDITLQPHGNYTNAMIFTTALATTGSDATGTKKLGTNASINDSGGTPMTFMQDIKFSIEPGALFDSSDRSVAIDTVIPCRFKYGATAKFIWDPATSANLAFWTAVTTGAAIELFILDGAYATTGSWGIHSDWCVTAFNLDAPLQSGQMIDVSLEPHGNGATAPVLVTRP